MELGKVVVDIKLKRPNYQGIIGESRVFICCSCGQVRHVTKAGLNLGTTLNRVLCAPCIAETMELFSRMYAENFLKNPKLYGG